MTAPIIIRAPRDHFHIRLNGEWYKNQTRNEAWSLLCDASLDPYPLLADAIVPPRMVSDIEFRPAGRRRWWVDGLPLPLKVVRYILMDEVGMTKEQCDLTIEALKLSYQCRQLCERIENEAMQELFEWCRQCLSSAKSGMEQKELSSAESTEPSSSKVTMGPSTPRAKLQSPTPSKSQANKQKKACQQTPA